MKKPGRQRDIETVLTIVVVLTGIYVYTRNMYVVYVSLGLGLMALLLETPTRYFVNAWWKLSEAIGFVTSKILMTAIYVIFLLPIAMLSRLFGKSGIVLKKKQENSYYVTRNYSFSEKDFTKPW